MRRPCDSQHGLRDIASNVASRSVAFDANDPVAPELEVTAELAATEKAARITGDGNAWRAWLPVKRKARIYMKCCVFNTVQLASHRGVKINEQTG
jgi:hypothetical protein